MFGYDLGVISGALPQLQHTFDLTDAQQEFIVSILFLGCGIGACVGGALCDRIGRKRTILLTDGVFFVGAWILYSAQTVRAVGVGRVVVGCAIAVSGIADVSYLHEMAPPDYRGAIVSVHEACIALGFLLAFGAGTVFSDRWRDMFGLGGFLAAVQFIGMWNLPESPKWLKHQAEELAVRRGDAVSPSGIELDPLQKNHHHFHRSYSSSASSQDHLITEQYQDNTDGTPVATNGGICASLRVFLRNELDFARTVHSLYHRQAVVAVFLACTQQLCGQTNVLSYAPLVFAGSPAKVEGGEVLVSGWAMFSIGAVKFIITVLVIWKIERLGRRFLLLSGMATLAVGLVCLILSSLSDAGKPALALPGGLLVVCGYSMSFGPITWLMTSELFPTSIRGRALGASTVVTYLMAALVTNTFLSLQSTFGTSMVFGFYLTVTLLGLVFVFLAIPETGGKSVHEISIDLGEMPWWRKSDIATVMSSEHLML